VLWQISVFVTYSLRIVLYSYSVIFVFIFVSSVSDFIFDSDKIEGNKKIKHVPFVSVLFSTLAVMDGQVCIVRNLRGRSSPHDI
jgi:hypothetical protein